MATKEEKKEIIRKQIIEAAKVYSHCLAGKYFLYVYGDEYFEILFRTDRFTHLTGVTTTLSAKDFYKQSKNGILTTNQFGFNPSHPYDNAKKKLPCLIRLPELTNSIVCIVKDLSTVTVTYKVGVTNLDFTLGLIENKENENKKNEHYFLPMTLRVADKSIEKSGCGEVVDFIFVREATKPKYTTLLYADKSRTLPHSIDHLLDDDFNLDKELRNLSSFNG